MDPVVATALLDRLLHHAIVIQSRDGAIVCASTPISSPSTSDRNPSSSRRRSRHLPSAAACRQKTEEPIKPTADHHARQSGEFCAPQTGEIPRPVDTNIMQSKDIVLLASGEHKRNPLRRLLTGTITPEFPASLLRKHSDCHLFCDWAAFSVP